MQRFMGSIVVVLCLIGIGMALSTLWGMQHDAMSKCMEKFSRDTCVVNLR